eukprot:COSAG04_NODE_6271_length_1368_cov_1.991332_3_plen_101_part_00
MATVDGVPMGCSRPRMLLLTPTGPLILVGGAPLHPPTLSIPVAQWACCGVFAGRNVVGGRGEPILWVNDAGDGNDWREFSLSGRHNALLPPRRESWKFSP